MVHVVAVPQHPHVLPPLAGTVRQRLVIGHAIILDAGGGQQIAYAVKTLVRAAVLPRRIEAWFAGPASLTVEPVRVFLLPGLFAFAFVRSGQVVLVIGVRRFGR